MQAHHQLWRPAPNVVKAPPHQHHHWPWRYHFSVTPAQAHHKLWKPAFKTEEVALPPSLADIAGKNTTLLRWGLRAGG